MGGAGLQYSVSKLSEFAVTLTAATGALHWERAGARIQDATEIARLDGLIREKRPGAEADGAVWVSQGCNTLCSSAGVRSLK